MDHAQGTYHPAQPNDSGPTDPTASTFDSGVSASGVSPTDSSALGTNPGDATNPRGPSHGRRPTSSPRANGPPPSLQALDLAVGPDRYATTPISALEGQNHHQQAYPRNPLSHPPPTGVGSTSNHRDVTNRTGANTTLDPLLPLLPSRGQTSFPRHSTVQGAPPPFSHPTPVTGPTGQGRENIPTGGEDSQGFVDHRAAQRYPPSPTAVLHIMRKWDLSFSGKRGEDVETFLTRVDEGRTLMPIRDTELIRCIPFFLTGIALQWFRNEQNTWNTWAGFKRACTQRFGDPDYQYALRAEIMRRTQGSAEPIADYLTCLRGLFNRLRPPWEESEQIQYAHRNMLPRFQIAIHRDDLFDFDSLQHIAIRVEKSFQAARTYQPPPTADHSLCAELAYHGPRQPRNPPKNSAFAALSLEELDYGGNTPSLPNVRAELTPALDALDALPSLDNLNALQNRPRPPRRREPLPTSPPLPNPATTGSTERPERATVLPNNPFWPELMAETNQAQPEAQRRTPPRPRVCWNC